jgi:peptidoglycan/LPS O-acetylase OafA/YrhL
MNYRPEIDGLRAVAVVPVILFHAGFGAFGGGYVGVDVFFVISGYLITSIILSEHAAGRFSLLRFYERRARRILPALFLVMAACLPFAWLWLMPSDMKDFSKSLAAVAVFASNVLFYRESGYFDAANELKPLLHTWSLAVEEQYYLLFPLLLLLALRLGRRSAVSLLAAVAAVSLGLAEWGSTRRPEATFYLLHTRLWELLIGGFVAFHFSSTTRGADAPTAVGSGIREALGIAGIALIGYAVLRYDRYTPYPSLYALVPTLGTALIILFSSGRTLVGRVLGSRLLAGIGLVSYSAYLWHQPIFAFARHRVAGEPTPILLAGLSVAAIALAYLSWRFVERPFRNRQVVATTVVVRAGLFGTALFLGLGLLGVVADGFRQRFPQDLYPLIEPAKSGEEYACKGGRSRKLGPSVRLCEFGDLDSSTTLVLYGDSHARSLFTALDAALKERKIRGVRVHNAACGPIPDLLTTLENRNVADCERANGILLQYLRENADFVVVAIRWTNALYPVAGAIDELAFDNTEGGREIGVRPRVSYTLKYGGYSVDAAGKERALHDFLTGMVGAAKHLFLVYPVPEVGWDLPRYNFKRFLDGALEPEVSTSLAVYERRNAFVQGALDRFGSPPNLTRIHPEKVFCDNYQPGRCVAQVGFRPLYHDDDHLSNAGAELVVAEILSRLPYGRERGAEGGAQPQRRDAADLRPSH